MQYRSVKGFSGAGQMGFLILFTGLGFILAGAAQLIIVFKIMPAGTALDKMADVMLSTMLDPKNVFYSRLAQVAGTFFLFFVPAILYSWITNGKDAFWLGFNRYVNLYQILLGFLIMFTASVMGSPLEEMSKACILHFPSLDIMAKKLEAAYNDQVLALSNLKSWPEFITALAIMAFFPALFEELFFRGAVQNLLVRWWKRPLLSIIVTSLLFSSIHGSIYLFLSRAVLGFVLGLMFYKTKNIWVNVIAHFLNNALAVAQLFSMSNSHEKMDVSKLDPKIDWWFALIAIGILVFLFRFLGRYSTKNIWHINAQEQKILAKNTSNPFVSTETIQLGN